MQISQKTQTSGEKQRQQKGDNGHFWTKNIINKENKQKAETE